MITTKIGFLETELQEVANLFEGACSVEIKHLFDEKENRVVNTFVFNGKSYAFGNLMPAYKDEIEYKRYIKRFAKLSLYKALSSYYGESKPWGALTGIRPTRLAYSQIEKEGDFTDFFISTMKVSQEKTLLTKRVIDTQKGIYVKDDANTDFFVFIPFCPSRCKYCSFIAEDVLSAQKYVDDYIDALITDIRESSSLIRKLRSIYIGGGTPVALSNENLERVLKEIDKFNTGVEFTVEAGRPDRITDKTLELFKKYKVTRICINPQTFNDKTLKKIGRNHTAKEVIDVYEKCKNDFIVNMDLICGLDGENFEDFKYSLDKAVQLSPDNITVHTLCVKRGSALKKETDRIDGTDVAEMVNYAEKTLTENGYGPYYLYRQKYMAENLENVGYCKKGKACVYNVDVMEEISQNVACGANAISKRVINGGEKIDRVAPPKDVKTYIEKLPRILEEKRKLFNI